jgi:hypothetical protein
LIAALEKTAASSMVLPRLNHSCSGVWRRLLSAMLGLYRPYQFSKADALARQRLEPYIA